MPITVLVNENSASASEILACSLKDNERAKIIGTKNLWKRNNSNITFINRWQWIKNNNRRILYSKGTTIHKVGIDPDEEVKLPDTVKSIYSVTKDEATQLKKEAIEILKNNE